MTGEPFSFVVKCLAVTNSPVIKSVSRYISDVVLDLSLLIDNVHRSTEASNTSRCNAYRDINPAMKVHDVYMLRHAIND